MKRKFQKPTISSYGVQAAYGQDAMEGACFNGSMPGHTGGDCTGGTSPLVANCESGTYATVDTCTYGGQVTPIPSCVTGTVPDVI